MSDFWYDIPVEGDDEESELRDYDDEVPGLVFAHVRSLDTQMSLLHELFAENAGRYAGKGVAGVGGPKAIGSFTTTGGDRWAVTENIVASVVDTATAMVATNRPKATFMTDGAEWERQQHAKKLTKAVVGLYDQLDIYKLWVRGFKDCAIQGVGTLKIIAGKDQPVVERVHIDRLIVDEQEAMDCPPRQIHQRRYVDRSVLARRYPDCADEIMKATSIGNRAGGTRNANLIEVIESWRLPTEKGAGDGRYAVCIEGDCLEWSVYKKDYFPFVHLHWNQPETGWYGQGIVEPITGLQIQLNQLNRFIRKCQTLIARPDIYGAFDQRMPDAFFENEVGRFFRTKDGRPPTFYTPQALNAETYNERRYVVERAFALAGVGEMTAQGKKQPGVESGIAIREVNDIQAGRFGIVAEAFEDSHIETAQRLVWAMKDITEAGRKPVKVAFRAKKFIETIDWADVDPEEDSYRIDVEASSLLSKTPAGRKQDAMDLLQIGAIDKSEFLYLLDDPDLQRVQDLKNVARSYAEYAIEKTNEGTYVAPEPFEDLALAMKLGQMARQKAKLDGAPEEILQLHQDRIDAARSLLEMGSAPAAAPAGMPMPGPEMGAPPMGMDPGMAPGVVPGAPLPPPGSPLPVV